MANATLRERQTQYKSCPQELYKLNAQQLIFKVVGLNIPFTVRIQVRQKDPRLL
jgi:hypothetical protein